MTDETRETDQDERDPFALEDVTHEYESDRKDADRREILKKLGRYGLYTAPALLAMYSGKARASICASG